jgi:hypothetical protein
MIKHPIRSFASGELSPQVDARSDVDKYRSGCRTMENFIPRIYGSAERRPGTKYKATCGGIARTVAFIYSNTVAYIILLEDQVMYFYTNGSQVNDGTGTRLSLTTPYLEDDLFELQFAQINDVMRITHRNYAPRELKRVSATEFRLEQIVFNNGPFMKRHDLAYDDGVTLTPSMTGESMSDDVTDEAGATYAASTTYNTTMAVGKAFDNNLTPPGCYWQSALGSYTDQWVYVKYALAKTIVQVNIAPFVSKPSVPLKVPYAYVPKYIKIQGSNDGTNWTKVSINGWTGNTTTYNTDEAQIGEITSPTEWVRYTLDNAVAYTYWRVYIAINQDTIPGSLSVVRINEIEMFEDTSTYSTYATLTASEPIFDEDHEGALFSLTQARENTNSTCTVTAPSTTTTTGLLVEGDFSFNTHGTWTGTVSLQRTTDQTLWETFRTWESANDRNVQYTGTEEEDNVYYRINVSSMTSGTINADITVNTSTQTGICRVLDYVAANQVTVSILKNFASTDATARWSEGCWSVPRGYPGAITFHETRCVYAGSTYQPQTVWFSATDDFEYFREGVNADDSFSVTLASDTRNAIQWISSLEALIVGTSGGEWRIRSSAYDEALSPTNVSAKQQTTYGSKTIQALSVNNVVLFVDFVGRKVREISYSADQEKYNAPDLTVLAEHITASGITSMAFQRNPDTILWCTLSNGYLLSMTYDRTQDVVAWARHTFDTTSTSYGVQSVAVIPSSTEDEIWLVVKRYINESTVYYLEQMQPRAVADQEDMWFVDCGVSAAGAPSISSVTGLDHLEGESVAIQADGGVQPAETVASGEIELTDSAAQAIVGLAYRYTLKPMRFDLDTEGGTKGSIKTFKEVVISFYRTLNAQYGVDVDNLFEIDWRGEEAYDSPPALYTGDKPVVHEGGFDVEDAFIITGNDPLPCTVRCIVPRIDLVGR